MGIQESVIYQEIPKFMFSEKKTWRSQLEDVQVAYIQNVKVLNSISSLIVTTLLKG